MPGISDAAAGADGFVVDARADATPAQIAAALRAVAQVAPTSARLYLGAGGTSPSLQLLDWRASMIVAPDAAHAADMGERADEVAAELTHLADTDGAVQRVVSIGSDLKEITIALDTPGFPTSGATAQIDSVYNEAARGWGTVTPTHLVVTAYDRSGETSTELAGIDATSGTRDLSSAAVDLAFIAANDRTWFPFVTQDASGATHLSYAITIPSDTASGDPLKQQDNPALWKEIDDRLAPLRSAEPGSTYRVSLVDNSGRKVIGYDPLVGLTLGNDGQATPRPDPRGLGWSAAAATAANAF